MLISFIIPVYNGQTFLKKCIDSILNQDTDISSFEIICIDDCSSDKSADILKEYEKNNTNFRCVLLEDNLKTGTACNIGLNLAKGDFIWIIGQDDWIENNSFKRLKSIITEQQPDVVAFNYNRVSFTENKLHSAIVFKDSPLKNGEEFIKTYFDTNFEYYLLGYEWRALFRREFLIDKKIKFQDGVIYEDTIFLFETILYAKRMISISDFLYNYRVNSYSITDINKKYKGNLIFEFAFVAGNEVLDLSKKIKKNNENYSERLFNKAIWYFESFSYKVVGASLTEKFNFYKLIRKNKKYVNSLIKLTPWYFQLLAQPIPGMIFSNILKPIYLIKNRLKDKQKQDWCY